MSTRAIDPSTLKFAKSLVRIKARQLLRVIRDAATGSQQDLEQDLLLEVVVRWPGFDPNRGNAEAFVESVVRAKLCKMLRDAKRAKRVPGPTVSADWSETLTYRDRGASFDVTTSGGASPGSPGPLVPTYPPSLALTPAFHEEFDGDLATQWVDHEPYWGPPGTAAYGNGSWFQAPAGSLAEVAGGIATLRNRACTNPGGFTMCGPDLSTRGKFETFVHGHVEARVKLPGNAGGWPGFWPVFAWSGRRRISSAFVGISPVSR